MVLWIGKNAQIVLNVLIKNKGKLLSTDEILKKTKIGPLNWCYSRELVRIAVRQLIKRGYRIVIEVNGGPKRKASYKLVKIKQET